MDQQLIRQCVGIDISKESFTACVCSYYRSGEEQLTEVFHYQSARSKSHHENAHCGRR